jgi:uncharacterized protein YeaO (DUF488 family)
MGACHHPWTVSTWNGHYLKKHEEFRVKYIEELRTDEQKLRIMDELIQLTSEGNVTLLYGQRILYIIMRSF